MVKVRKQLGFKMNLQRCIGCRGCEMACRNENELTENNRRTVHTLNNPQDHVMVYLSMACNHCENPACITACPELYYKKRRDGIVVHDPTACIGCKSCIGACPFGAPKYNHITKKVDKCNMCVDRLEEGLHPACVSACMMGALKLTDLSKEKMATQDKWYSGIPMANFTNPSVRFVIPKGQPTCHVREAETV